MKTYAIVVTVILAVFATLTFVPGGPFRFTDIEIPPADTVRIYDTIREPPPPPEKEYVTRYEKVPYPVPGETIRDTIYIEVPITQREYRTDDYFAVIEGYNPNLLQLDIFRKETIINKPYPVKVKPKWGIGIQVGYGIGKNPTPYLGVGLQYNILTF